MVMYTLVLLSYLAARSWADGFQPILTQISAGDNECNGNGLLGGFDLNTVPQFNALCNIPIPEFQQSEFLLENNVVPILCMGLMDVSFRLCKSAKDDVSVFTDIFPPTTNKFNNIFILIRESNDFSSLDEFCTTTVNKFAVKEAASNVTELWWQVLNKQFSDEKHCSNICHSNEENKVHPLCSYILWSNGVFINYQKNKVDGQVATSMGEDKKFSIVRKLEKPIDQGEKSNHDIGFVKNELPYKATEAVVTSDVTPLTYEKPQIAEANKSSSTSDNNNVGVGTVEQVVNNGDQSAVFNTIKTDAKPSGDFEKLAKKVDIPKSRKHKIKETATVLNPTGSLNAGVGDIVLGKPVPSIGQVEVKVDPKASAAAESSNLPEPQAGAPIAPEPQKQGLEPGKAAEGMVEGDFTLEVTPDGVGMDQPILADKGFQPPYSDEEGEDGDGDDVDIVESNGQASSNTASNGSSPVASKASITGVASIQQRPLEGDKVYGEGEILIEDHFIEAEDSHFFTYFLCMTVLTIMAYLAFHNKKKLIALAVEGRRTKGARRRPNSSHYSKLDCSLEEALVSNTTASVTHVLY